MHNARTSADAELLNDRAAQPERPRANLPAATRRLLPLLAVAIVLLLPLRGLLRAPGAPMEEGFMLVFPERVLRGAIPNVDFLHLYGPGSLWVLAAVYKVFGTSLWSERLFGYLQQVALVCAVFTLALPWGRWLAAAAAAVAAIIIVPPNGLTALAWVGGVALALWSAVAALDGRHAADEVRARRSLLAAGVLGGFALLYRPDLVLAIGLGLGVVAWDLARPRRNRLLAGLALGVAPMFVHLAIAGLANSIQGMVVDPLVHLRGGRHLPLPPSWNHWDGFLQKAGQLDKPPWPLPTPLTSGQLSLWLMLLLASVAFLLIVARRSVRRDRTSHTARTLSVVAVMSLGLVPQALQRADSTHLAWVSFLPIGFLPMGMAMLLRNRPSRRLTNRGRVVAVATPFVLLAVMAPNFTLSLYADATRQSFGVRHNNHTMRNGSRVFYYGRADAAAAVNAMLVDVDRLTKPGQRLFVGTGDLRKTPYSEAFLYYLLPDLPPATYYIEMDPGVANAPGSRLARDLESADVVVLSSIRDDWDEPNDSRNFGSDVPNQVLHRDFCLEHSYGRGLFGHGLYELYFRCAHMPVASS